MLPMHRTALPAPPLDVLLAASRSEHSALIFGNPDIQTGPSLAITTEGLGFGGRGPAAERRIAHAASQPVNWLALDEMRRTLPPAVARAYRLNRLRGVISVPVKSAPPAERFSLVFTYPRDADALQALYEVEAREGRVSHPLVAAVLAAVQSRRYPCPAPGLFGAAAAAAPPPHGAPAVRCNRRELEALAEHALATLAAGGAPTDLAVPASAVDAARLWLLLARRLWDPAARRPLVNLLWEMHGPQLSTPARLAAQLAAGWLDLQGIRETTVAGMPLALPAWPVASLSFWLQVLALDAAAAPPAALPFLLDGRLPLFPSEEGARLQQAARGFDAELARGITAALLAEAQAHAAYAPAGAFTVALPAEHPLAGLAPRLRVWLTPDCLWCAPEGRQGALGLLRWRPDRPWSGAGPDGPLALLLEPLLAALWHDLHVAGPAVLPEIRPPRAVPQTPPQAERAEPTVAAARRLALPAARPVQVAGLRGWGTTEEQERIRRQAHGVRGHLRRLLAGAHVGAAAARCAQRYGLAVPEGFTFVRPHVRGGQAVDNGVAPTPIRARGLATLMTLLHPAERADGH